MEKYVVTTKMWSRHKLANELFVVLLRGNGMFGKNAFAGGGQSLAANVTALVTVQIGVSRSRIGTYVLTANSATGGALVSKRVLDAVKLCIAVLARLGARIKTNMTAGGILRIADGAFFGASVIIFVLKTGCFAANRTDAASLFCRSNVHRGSGSLFTAFIAGGVAITGIGVSYGIGNHKCLTAVAANGTADILGLVSGNSVTGGASCSITGGVAIEGIRVSGNRLATALNLANTVTIRRIVVVADMIANGAAFIADGVCIGIYMLCRLGSTASVASLRVAEAFPNVLLTSVKATAVIAHLVAGGGISMRVIFSLIVTSAAGAAASVFVIMELSCNGSGSTAVCAGNGALVLINVCGVACCTAEFALRGAGKQPGVNERLSRSDLFLADTALRCTGVRKGVNHIGSLFAANRASGRAIGCVGVLEIGAECVTNTALGCTVVRVSMSDGCNGSFASGADLAVAGLALVLNRGCSFNRGRAAVTERIAIRSVLMAFSTETTRKRDKCQGYGKEQEENSFHFSLQKLFSDSFYHN